MSEELNENISWSPVLEGYFVATGEKCRCLAWLHNRAEAIYSKRRQIIDLPMIVLGSAVGFLQVGSETMFDNQKYASVALGVASLFVSVMNTINSYYQWAKRAEGHRINALHYGKLYRFICVQMGLPQHERIRAHDFLAMVKESYDRLQEVAPPIPPEVITEFKGKFSDKKYEEVARPEETNGLEKIRVYNNYPVLKIENGSQPSANSLSSGKREDSQAIVLSTPRPRAEAEKSRALLQEESGSTGAGDHPPTSGKTSEAHP